MRSLLKVSNCENGDHDSKLGPCQPTPVLEQTVPRALCGERGVVCQDPNLLIQDVAQLLVSACVQLPTHGLLQDYSH